MTAQPAPAVWAMCAKKKRYPTQPDAVRAAARRVRKVAYLRTYRCPHCAGWHLTHKHPGGDR